MLMLENSLGQITVDDSVIAGIASMVASNCFGIAGMEAKNMTEEFWALFKKDSSDRGIEVKCEKNEIYITLHIAVMYGVNIPAITESISHKVSYTVRELLGFPVAEVNIFVESVKTK